MSPIDVFFTIASIAVIVGFFGFCAFFAYISFRIGACIRKEHGCTSFGVVVAVMLQVFVPLLLMGIWGMGVSELLIEWYNA
tara:strand:- start:781 stop:1023 length:243 start_codon:yes stop_codon:yes gene_type:complete